MTDFDSPPSVEELIEYSDNYWNCWLKRSRWLLRKVSQIEYIDRTTLEFVLAYDVDIARLKEVSEVPVLHYPNNQTRMLLPLDDMTDRPYMTNSLESPWGDQACLATRREVARFVTFLFFGIIQSRFSQDPYVYLNDTIARDIFKSLLSAPVDSKFDEDVCKSLGYKSATDIQRINAVLSWLRNSTFVLLNVPVDDTTRTFIEFSFTAFRDTVSRNWFDRWGITASSILVSSVSKDDYDLGTHTRIMIPSGMRVDKIEYEWLDKPISDSDKAQRDAYTKQISTRSSGKVVTIYAPMSLARPMLDIRIYMNPKREIFTIPAYVACLVSYAVCQTVSYWISSLPASPPHTTTVPVLSFPAQAITPVAALVPAFVASFILVAREHESLSFALGFRRALLGIGAVSSVIFSVVLALGMSDGIAGECVRRILLMYIILQFGLLVFFLFDIIRVGIWRQKFKLRNFWIGFWIVAMLTIWIIAAVLNAFLIF